MEQIIGAAIGSSIGLLALLAAALFNAHLQRRRDDRLRQKARRTLAAMAFADFDGALRLLLDRFDTLQAFAREKKDEGYDFGLRLRLPELFCTETLRADLGILPPATAGRCVMALRSYEMADVLLALAAGELARESADEQALASRAGFIRSSMGTIRAAMEDLATIAGVETAWAEIKNDPTLERR